MWTFYPNIFFNATASNHSLLVFKLILENVIQIWCDRKDREGDWSQEGWRAGPGVRWWGDVEEVLRLAETPFPHLQNEANLWLAGSLWRLDGIAWIKKSSVIPNPQWAFTKPYSSPFHLNLLHLWIQTHPQAIFFIETRKHPLYKHRLSRPSKMKMKRRQDVGGTAVRVVWATGAQPR